MRTAVVTVVRGRHDHLALQQRALDEAARGPDDRVVVAMDDPWVRTWAPDGVVVADVPLQDGRLPLARARNLGARLAVERGADLLVLLDVDCVPAPGLLDAYVAAAGSHPHALLCGPVSYLPPPGPDGYRLDGLDALAEPHPARPAPPPGDVVEADDHDLFWSLSFAATRVLWNRLGGFDEAYTGYGAEDTDLGRRARAAGVPLAWVGGARAHHQHHPVSSPPVEHVEDVVRNATVFHERWGEWPMRGWLDAFVALDLVRRDASGHYVLTASGGPAGRDGPPGVKDVTVET